VRRRIVRQRARNTAATVSCGGAIGWSSPPVGEQAMAA
jgi:hypothetical protein